jgi:hypothetical protein
VERVELAHQGGIQIPRELLDGASVLAERGVHGLVEGRRGLRPAAQHAPRGHLVEVLILEREEGLEPVADEAKLVAKPLLGQVLRARLGDVLLHRHRDKERHRPGRRPIVVHERRQLVDLRHVRVARFTADPDHQLIDEPGDGREAVIFRVAGDTGEALRGSHPQVLRPHRRTSVVAPGLEARRQVELLREIAAPAALVELGAGECLLLDRLGHQLVDASVVPLGVLLDQLEDPLLVGELERRRFPGQRGIEGGVERRAQGRLAHHVDPHHQGLVFVEPIVARAERGQRGIADLVDSLVALQHLAEHRHQVGFAAPEGAIDEPPGVTPLGEPGAHVTQQGVDLFVDLLGQDKLLQAATHPLLGVVEAGDELVEGGDLGQIEGFTDQHRGFSRVNGSG